MWTREKADTTGKLQSDSPQYEARDAATCWTTDSQGIDQGDNAWDGNQRYFTALVASMMEHDNTELSTTVQRTFSNFNVVFDESRHVAGALTMPFTEAVGAVVLLTSDGLLKWLIGMNLFALLAIAIMVVPEKENWRHVFDLTRFRERPTKLIRPSTNAGPGSIPVQGSATPRPDPRRLRPQVASGNHANGARAAPG